MWASKGLNLGPPDSESVNKDNAPKVGFKLLYEGLLKEWQDKEHATDYFSEITKATGYLSTELYNWLDSIGYDKFGEFYHPYQAHVCIKYVPITKIYYSVGNERFAITILGTKHRIVYITKPEKLSAMILNVKNKLSKYMKNLFGNK